MNDSGIRAAMGKNYMECVERQLFSAFLYFCKISFYATSKAIFVCRGFQYSNKIRKGRASFTSNHKQMLVIFYVERKEKNVPKRKICGAHKRKYRYIQMSDLSSSLKRFTSQKSRLPEQAHL